MKQKDALELLTKYRSGACSDEEKALLEAWYLEWRDEATDPRPDELKAARDKTWKELSTRNEWKKAVSFPYRYAAAAVFTLCLLSAGLWFIEKNPTEKIAPPIAAAVPAHDAVPGKNKAMLTLADGKVITLDEAKNGKLAEVEGIDIRKTADGQIVYEVAPVRAGASNADAPLEYNEISTPRGGQYRVTLPDGTNVWLNAASSVKYPVKFLENVRRVELTGEGYFEVSKVHSAHGMRTPFVVDTPTESVEVLGTRFNINAYEDEAGVKTTLLEGSVRVSIKQAENQPAAGSLLLVPDQQSVLAEGKLILHNVNAEEMMAWKDGYFSFDHADIKTIMRQLARWYDLEVVYKGEVSPNTFSGKVYRNMNLSRVLEVLAFSQVNFRIEGKKIMIFS